MVEAMARFFAHLALMLDPNIFSDSEETTKTVPINKEDMGAIPEIIRGLEIMHPDGSWEPITEKREYRIGKKGTITTRDRYRGRWRKCPEIRGVCFIK